MSLLILAASAAHAGKVKYTYDSADRLTDADYGAGKVTTLGYDANGNLLNRTTQTAVNADVRFSASSALPNPTAAGNIFTYSFTITNDGPDPATGVSFDDVVPFGIEPTGGTASQGAGLIAGRTVGIELGVIGPGSTATITLSARAGFAGAFNNTASVAANEADPNLANNTASVATTATTPQDSDGDGMPNWWEALRISSGAPFSASPFSKTGANDDFDGDGISNFDEWIADTLANDVHSFFLSGDFSLTAGTFSITFPTSPFRRYAVERSTNLPLGFNPIATGIEGTGLDVTVEDPTAPAGGAVYRVRATIP